LKKAQTAHEALLANPDRHDDALTVQFDETLYELQEAMKDYSLARRVRNTPPVKRRRRPGLRNVRPLTPRQLEATQAVADCEGNLSKAAKRLGIARNTLLEIYNAANEKLGIAALKKHRTHSTPKDRRGQDNLPTDADRRKQLDL
jgi:predicted DNA-binding protein (UPF0251 family)